MVVLFVVFLTVFVGSCMQRVSGMGLGLIGGPVLALLLGPVEGILVVNVLACVNAALISVNVRKNIDWKILKFLAPALVLGAIPGALVVREAPADVLQIAVGGLLLVALAIVTWFKSDFPPAHGGGPAVGAGIAAGFMNALAGIAGPALTVYAQASRWEQRKYAATLQPCFFVSGLFSFVLKVGLGAASLEHTNPWIWVAGGLAMCAGIATGIQISQHVERGKAYKLALGLAATGGIVTMTRGVISVVGD